MMITLVILFFHLSENEINKHFFSGIFHFRFWQYGDWYDVVVDDYLPFSLTLNKLAFARNDTDQNEFWVSLVVIYLFIFCNQTLNVKFD